MLPHPDLAKESERLLLPDWRVGQLLWESLGVSGKLYLLVNMGHLQSLAPGKRMDLNLSENHSREVHLLRKTQFHLEQIAPDSKIGSYFKRTMETHLFLLAFVCCFHATAGSPWPPDTYHAGILVSYPLNSFSPPKQESTSFYMFKLYLKIYHQPTQPGFD